MADNREMLYTLLLPSTQECVVFLMRIRRSNIWEKKKIKNITSPLYATDSRGLKLQSTNWKNWKKKNTNWSYSRMITVKSTTVFTTSWLQTDKSTWHYMATKQLNSPIKFCLIFFTHTMPCDIHVDRVNKLEQKL